MATVRRYYVEVRNSGTNGFYWQEAGAFSTREEAEILHARLMASKFGSDNVRINEAWAFDNDNVSHYDKDKCPVCKAGVLVPMYGQCARCAR